MLDLTYIVALIAALTALGGALLVTTITLYRS